MEEGRDIIRSLYAFRSCGKAFPQVQKDQPDKEDHYRSICQILRPEISKMLGLMAFRDRLIALFSDVLNGIIVDTRLGDIFPSENFLVTLANYVDLIVSIDVMKNFKGSMNNDLSTYKRCDVPLIQSNLFLSARTERSRANGASGARVFHCHPGPILN